VEFEMAESRLREETISLLDRAVDSIGQVILGKNKQIRLAIACLISRGHLLIEDLPGVGKTTLSHVIAQVMGLDFQRIQFTSDLLPSDVLGLSVYNRDNGSFEFHPGPVFSNLILADEVNRATPKTQSALLEAMEEHQVTIEGQTRALPEPFFVIATQNPMYQIGTFPLPESQLDRFLMRLHLGFPNQAAERELLQGEDRRTLISGINPVFSPEKLQQVQLQSAKMHVSDALIDYIQAILEFSRSSPLFENGLSPRGGLALVNSAKAWAMTSGHDFVVPEHVKAVLSAVVNHRIVVAGDETESSSQLRAPAEIIAEAVPVP